MTAAAPAPAGAAAPKPKRRRARRPGKVEAARNAQLRFIHGTARSLGLDEEERRDVYERATAAGLRSLSEMTTLQVAAVAAEFQKLSSSAGSRLPPDGTTSKLRALWLSGWHLGVVRDRRDSALAAFVRRVTGLDVAAWARKGRAEAPIEAVKGMIAREAHLEWPAGAGGLEARCVVIDAQLKRILREYRDGLIVEGLDAKTAHGRLDALIQQLGVSVRMVTGLAELTADDPNSGDGKG